MVKKLKIIHYQNYKNLMPFELFNFYKLLFEYNTESEILIKTQDLADMVNMNVRKVRRILKKLIDLNLIKTEQFYNKSIKAVSKTTGEDLRFSDSCLKITLLEK